MVSVQKSVYYVSNRMHMLEVEKFQNSPKIGFSTGPHAPEQPPRGMLEHTTLTSMRDALTSENIDPPTIRGINTMIERWRNNTNTVAPLAEMQSVLERARKTPRGDERIKLMNSVVRTLSRPEALATFLDMLRDS